MPTLFWIDLLALRQWGQVYILDRLYE